MWCCHQGWGPAWEKGGGGGEERVGEGVKGVRGGEVSYHST